MLVGPRVNGAFFHDDELKLDAPDAWEILRSGTDAVASRGQTLASARPALLKLCARALVKITSVTGAVNCSVKALRPVERSADGSQLPSFTAFELAVSLAPALQAAAVGPVAAFYRQLAPRLSDAWLFDHAGRPAGYPAHVTRLSEIEDMAKSVASALTWREHLSGVVGPVMSVFLETSRDSVRCLAVDAGYVVLASGSGLEMSLMVSAWRTVQQGSGAP